ncbi:hypothetical protein MNNICLKF_02471 [Synechococcus sp. CBW1107]|nr:hypothetical protein MNNICLKF_02471 [Synechococcus sp. CBW1107]
MVRVFALQVVVNACPVVLRRYIQVSARRPAEMTASIAALPSGGSGGPSRPGHRGGAARAFSAAAPAAGRSLRLVAQQEGLLQVHTAPFRGSFSGVFSQALRSAGLGSRVLISQFLKGGVEQGLERSVWLCGRLQWLRPAVASCLAQPAAMDEVGRAEREAVLEVWSFTREQMLAGQLDQLVLDELGLAVELGFLQEAEVVAALEQRPSHLDVILTGPSIPSALLAMADQVTQLRRGF